jgi:hypothetical protein
LTAVPVKAQSKEKELLWPTSVDVEEPHCVQVVPSTSTHPVAPDIWLEQQSHLVQIVILRTHEDDEKEISAA